MSTAYLRRIRRVGGQPIFEAVDDPHRLALLFLEGYKQAERLTLRFYRGEWLEWNESAYRAVTNAELQARLSESIKAEFNVCHAGDLEDWQQFGKGKLPEAKRVTRTIVSNATLALQGLALLPGSVEAPAWLAGKGPFPADGVIPTANELVYLAGQPSANGKPSRLPATPAFFCTYSLPFHFNPNAPDPIEWHRFLKSVWPNDPDSIATLQEWFGYCLLPDTRQQKILALIGPKRAGKDTIGRVLSNLVGTDNTAGPTLASLASAFGLAPLIGKPLAIVSDARITGRTDSGIIIERLLTISGEGRVTIDRKYLEAWTGKLTTRFVLISNELPRLTDASGALASRLVILRLTESFYGKEDKGLFNRLVPELPGILLWAIQGWRRLQQRGHFLQPESGATLVEAMEELSSPILAFTRDLCEIGPGKEIECKILFARWQNWCDGVGRREYGTIQSFGKDLAAAHPAIATRATNEHNVRTRYFTGIDGRVVIPDPDPANQP
jgi:putative DNA primase/helicase